MSASFWLEPHGGEDNFNLTYNLSKMFQCVSGGDSLSEWMTARDGMTAQEILPDAELILDRLQAEPGLVRMNPSNGWGSYDNFLKVWGEFVAALYVSPTKILGS